MTTQAGVESLALTRGDNDNIRFDGCAQCWVKNVDSSHWLNFGIALSNAFQSEIRDSYLHNGCWPVPGGGGYAIAFSFGASEILIENNISLITNKNIVVQSCGAGSVVSYNYFDDAMISGSNPNWVEVHANASHMLGSHHVLFEGNYAVNWDSDKTHGNSTYLTTFRNYFRGYRKAYTDPCSPSCPGTITEDDSTNASAGPVRTHGPAAYGYWMSAVGNILGIPTTSATWIYSSTNNEVMTSNSRTIFALGWDDFQANFGSGCTGTCCTGLICRDPNVASGPRAILRDGNWDYATSSVHWDSAATTLPNSMYGLSSAPPFFSCGATAFAWPPWNPSSPAVTCPSNPGSNCLPAKARFDANQPFTCQ